MSPLILIEHSLLLYLVAFISYLLWQRHQERLKKLWEAAREAARIPRPWKAKLPADCPACQSGLQLAIHPIRRDVKPWSTYKSSRGRKKKIRTQGHACPNPDCRYFGNTDEKVHALVGNGKRGKRKDIQTLKCQCCQTSFSTRRNTPLYHLKTHPDRVEMCLWLLAEGMDLSVLVRFSGHVDATLSRWLTRAGQHSARLHSQVFTDLTPGCIQVDELSAPIVGDRKNWLWLSIDPATKIVPAFHLGRRTTQDAMVFIHLLNFTLAPGCVPLFLSDGINQYTSTYSPLTSGTGSTPLSSGPGASARSCSMPSSSNAAVSASTLANPSLSPA